MASGAQMLIESAMKMLLSHMKITPEEVKNEFAKVQQIMATHIAQQNRIIADLALIKSHLGITEDENGQSLGTPERLEPPRDAVGKQAVNGSGDAH